MAREFILQPVPRIFLDGVNKSRCEDEDEHGDLYQSLFVSSRAYVHLDLAFSQKRQAASRHPYCHSTDASGSRTKAGFTRFLIALLPDTFIARVQLNRLPKDVFDIIKANNPARTLQPEDLLDSDIEVASTTDSGVDTPSTTTQSGEVPTFDLRNAMTAEPSCLPDLQTTSPTAEQSCQNTSSPGSTSTSSSSLRSRAPRSSSPPLEVDQWQVEVDDCATKLFNSATSLDQTPWQDHNTNTRHLGQPFCQWSLR
ncbi:hypothetical protein BDN72DRAFT_894772 [Pluteus cervinus]|uniref:Uncharacterized protein n=1 Tax=Pluteus cervinus TaxID=181527 RepID=A0ACD3B3H1_9AGAR|nr:hypothetical protein BDN72DRAFT_894772 [Pluteus cervinus]